MKFRILLVDNREILRKGLVSLLSRRWEVCGEARNGKEAIALVNKAKPDLVLLDLSMPKVGGAQAARAIRQ